MAKIIILATALQYPDLSQDDQVLLAAMKRRGLNAVPVVWDSEYDWSSAELVVVRSIWDYHLKFHQFLAWLAKLDSEHVTVQNPTALLRRNADKRYLLDLEAAGVRITPTRVVSRAEQTTLSRIMTETGWRSAVIKPVVSSTGYETWIVSTVTERDEEHFAQQVSAMAVLVQEFAEEVKDGEYSFVFLGGNYSHCILKRAAADEFRVHIEHGGTVESYDAAQEHVDWAKSVVATLEDQPWSYARVDAVLGADGMKLMEFELLDPELFFSYKPEAAETFIDVILG